MAKAKERLATPEVIRWLWTAKKDGKKPVILLKDDDSSKAMCPVKLRVTYDRVKRYYPVIHNNERLFLTGDEWDDIRSKNVRGKNQKIRLSINTATTDAAKAIDTITRNDKPFTWDRFEAEYISQESRKGFLKLFTDHLEDLRKEGRVGTWKAYKNAYSAFNKFRGGTSSTKTIEGKQGKELSPFDITPALLKKFESYMKEQDAGRNSVAMYMRALKVIFNLAVSTNPSLAEFTPFAKGQSEKHKYKIKTGAGHKGEALSIEQLQQLMDLKTEQGTDEDEAKNLWLFSFHAQGMNLRDIALLKYSDVDLKKQVITYVRQKTRETETIETPIEIPLNDAIRKIIISLGNPDKKPGAYVFGILQPRMDIERQDVVIRQKIKMINKRLKDLCEANDLPVITTYWARHSYANLQKESGASIDEIRELLGHSDMRTTEAYLKRFDIDRKRKANDRIEEMLKKKTA